jgi:ribosomal protein S18 acetylase RimI-like enzyme
MKLRHFTTTLLDSNSAHIQQALGVLTGELGENYVPREVLETYIYDNNNFSGKVAFIAQDDMTGDVLGTLIAEIVSPQAFKASFLDSFDLARDLPDVQQLGDRRIGLIRSVAVVPQFQRQGIGTQLVKEAMKKLEEHGAEVFYSLGWVSKERGCHIQGVLEALDFKMLSQFDSFWYQDSIKHGYSCPSCGHPCQCSTRLFVKWTRGLPQSC